MVGWDRLGDADVTHPAMVAIVIVLTLVHKRLRLRRLTEIREYYEEQMTYVFREICQLLSLTDVPACGAPSPHCTRSQRTDMERRSGTID